MNKSLTRRIIALIFSVCGAGVLSYLIIAEGSEPALTALIAIVSSVISFYFGVKSQM